MTRFASIACVVLLAAACGEVKGDPDASAGMADADTTDGQADVPDAAPPDAQTRGTVTVEVLSLDNDGLPSPGATVLFHEPDGSLADRILTDSDGLASAELDVGGSITVVRLFETSTYLTTAVDVAPGDTITVGDLASPFQNETGTVTVDLPPNQNATFFYVDAGCGSSSGQSTSQTVTLYDCASPGPVMGRTRINDRYYWVGLESANRTDGATVDMTGESWNYPDSFEVSVTNVPAGLSSVRARRVTLADKGGLFFASASQQEPSAGAIGMSVDYPSGFGDSSFVNVRAVQRTTESQIQHVATKFDSVPGSHGVDFGDSLLPWVTRPTFDGDTVSWTADGSGTPDVAVLDLNMSAPNETFSYGSWRVVHPPGATSFTLPTLPNDLDQRWHETGAQYSGHTTLIETDIAADYAAFRNGLIPRADHVYFALERVLFDQASGQVRVSTTRFE